MRKVERRERERGKKERGVRGVGGGLKLDKLDP